MLELGTCGELGSQEQRRFPRRETEFDMVCGLSPQSAVTGVVVNVSAGGCLFRPEAGYVDGRATSDTLPYFDVGQRVVLELDGPGRMLAEVRWTGEPGVGLEYLGAAPRGDH